MTKFQDRIDPKKDYRASELRQLVLEEFPVGRQAPRRGEPVVNVPFQGLANIRNSFNDWRNGNRDNFDTLYFTTHYSGRSREQVLEDLIPDNIPPFVEGFVTVTELVPYPAEHSTTTRTVFDFNRVNCCYKLRRQ